MATSPKWSTPIRKAQLVKLFLDSGGFCILGHRNCTIPAHHYEIYIENLIDDWKEEDKLDWRLERLAMHNLGERRYPVTGRFNNISQDIFHDKQPLYYLEGLGMSGVTLVPFARVKIASSYLRLYIDLGNSLRGTSKNKRRKAIRYGKELPKSIQERISDKVRLAVRDYINH